MFEEVFVETFVTDIVTTLLTHQIYLIWHPNMKFLILMSLI